MADPEAKQDASREEFPWQLGVFDAHCHPTDTIASLDHIPKMKARALTIMASRGQDQDLVRQFARKYGIEKESLVSLCKQEEVELPKRIVPSFGWHPWFSHQIFDDTSPVASDFRKPDAMQHYRSVLTPTPDDHDFISSLPEPKPLSELLAHVRKNLEEFPYALVGEIGIDRSFRLPMHWAYDEEANRDESLTPGGREGRQLSPYRVQIGHQRKILKTQLNLAGELKRPVSIHGVAAHGIVHETLEETWKGYEREIPSKRQSRRRSNAAGAPENGITSKPDNSEGKHETTGTKPYPPRICLHSYSGPPDALKQYLVPSIPAPIYFSFSCLVNLSSRTDKAVAVIKAVPDDRILVESDLHSAGDKMDQLLEDVVRSVCKIKGWTLTAGVNQLAENWKRFVFGQRGADQLSLTVDNQ
ncbi:MAG: hypothetical protein L6R38_001614 [Xanthoria sp. 2 TBL-2021]|nr:MAG: hypothetical protein L6R38_001614 [Xanthoria sp. 2 TBL-2021]